VGGREKGANKEENGNDTNPFRERGEEGNSYDHYNQQKLHGKHPASLGTVLINLGPPQEFQNPWQAKERGKADGFKADPHIAEKDRRNDADDGIGESFSKVGGEGPYVRDLQDFSLWIIQNKFAILEFVRI